MRWIKSVVVYLSLLAALTDTTSSITKWRHDSDLISRDVCWTPIIYLHSVSNSDIAYTYSMLCSDMLPMLMHLHLHIINAFQKFALCCIVCMRCDIYVQLRYVPFVSVFRFSFFVCLLFLFFVFVFAVSSFIYSQSSLL